MSGDNKLSLAEFHNPKKGGRLWGCYHLATLKIRSFNWLIFHPPNSFPETWRKNHNKNTTSGKICSSVTVTLSCSYLVRKGGDISKQEKWWKTGLNFMKNCSLTLQGTNISPKNGILKMIFLFQRWDMLISWRVSLGPIQLGNSWTSTPPGISFAFMTLFSPFWGCHMPHALECLRGLQHRVQPPKLKLLDILPMWRLIPNMCNWWKLVLH